jgi:hypothetical protein
LKIRISLIAVFAALMTALMAQPVGAASSSIKVTTVPSLVNFCRAAPDQLSFQFHFKAKIKRKNSGLPKRVTVTYKVRDITTGLIALEDKVTLKPKSFEKDGKVGTYLAGHDLQYELKSTFKSPNNGKKINATATIPDHIPTVEEMDAANPPIPPCPPPA